MTEREKELTELIIEKVYHLSADRKANYLCGVQDGLAMAKEIALSLNLNLDEDDRVKSFSNWIENQK